MTTYIVLCGVIVLIYYLAIWTLRHDGKPPEEQTGLFRERVPPTADTGRDAGTHGQRGRWSRSVKRAAAQGGVGNRQAHRRRVPRGHDD